MTYESNDDGRWRIRCYDRPKNPNASFRLQRDFRVRKKDKNVALQQIEERLGPPDGWFGWVGLEVGKLDESVGRLCLMGTPNGKV